MPGWRRMWAVCAGTFGTTPRVICDPALRYGRLLVRAPEFVQHRGTHPDHLMDTPTCTEVLGTTALAVWGHHDQFIWLPRSYSVFTLIIITSVYLIFPTINWFAFTSFFDTPYSPLIRYFSAMQVNLKRNNGNPMKYARQILLKHWNDTLLQELLAGFDTLFYNYSWPLFGIRTPCGTSSGDGSTLFFYFSL